MDMKQKFIDQIKIVIHRLETDYKKDITSGVLKLIYTRYKVALRILEGHKDLKEINLFGGVRAYMDSYSDYQSRLLQEMHEAESIFKKYTSIIHELKE